MLRISATFCAILLLLVCAVGVGRDLLDILGTKELRVGIRNISSEVVYFPKNENRPGFCFELAKDFADYLHVKMKIVEFDNLYSYFDDGVFDKVDIIADVLTITDARKKVMNLVPFVENGEILFGRTGESVSKLEDLKGKRVLVLEGFVFFNLLKTELDNAKIGYVVNMVYPTDNDLQYLNDNYTKASKNVVEILLVSKDFEYYDYFDYVQVIQKNADVGIVDTFSFAQKYFNTLFLKQNIVPLMLLRKEIGYLGFGFSKNSPLLAKEFERFLTYAKSSGIFNTLFKKYMTIYYSDYLNAIEK